MHVGPITATIDQLADYVLKETSGACTHLDPDIGHRPHVLHHRKHDTSSQLERISGTLGASLRAPRHRALWLTSSRMRTSKPCTPNFCPRMISCAKTTANLASTAEFVIQYLRSKEGE